MLWAGRLGSSRAGMAQEEQTQQQTAPKCHLLVVPPPRGDEDQTVWANPDLEEHVAPMAQDGQQAGVLLQ